MSSCRSAVLCGVFLTVSVAQAASAWTPIACPPVDPSPDALFEVVRSVDGFEGPAANWKGGTSDQNAAVTVQRDTREFHGGAASLRLDYRFVGKPSLEYLELDGAAEFAEPGLGFGFWMKTDGTPFALRLRFLDASGECHQTDLLGSSTAGWQFVAGALDAPSEAWGGDGNKRKDYPCRLVGICLDRPSSGFVGSGSLWIDDAAVVRPVAPPASPLKVEVQDRRFGNLYAVAETVALRVSGEGARVRWRLEDFFGRTLTNGEAASASPEVRFALPHPGWFACRLESLAENRVAGTEIFSCAALAVGAETAGSDFLGVCTHFGQGSYPLEIMELMRRYGIDQFRDEISWGACEKVKGQVTLPDFAQAYLKRAAALQLRPLIIYDYANRLYDNGAFPNSAEAIAGFANYAVELTRHTRGTVRMFEVWNEWVGACGMEGKPGRHDGEAYGRLLQPTYAAVKKAFPEVTVVGIGGEYGPKCADMIRDAVRIAGPDAMDAWSIHPYRYPRSPEASDLAGEVRHLASQVAGIGVKGKAWVTEIGYPTHRTTGGSDEAAQARHLVRTLVLLQSTPAVEKVFWYDLKDDGLSREDREANFGLVRHQRFNCAPKPAMVAASVFARLTAGAGFKELKQDGDLWRAVYRRPDGKELVVAWRTQASTPLLLVGKVESAWDLMGDRLPAVQLIETGVNPVYVLGRELGTTRGL